MFNVIYIPKIEDEVVVATFETKVEADAHMDYIGRVKPQVLPFHYIKEEAWNSYNSF
jgi:hypothetical protein